MKKSLSSFACLNLAQFFSALNDNIFKLLLIFLLISVYGAEKSSTVLALAGGIFVVPFIIFANFAGTLADRFSKRLIIVYTRFFELINSILGVLFFYLKSGIGLYLILFVTATLSAIFSPSKYGIVPEIVPKEKISRSNGLLSAFTYLAIILGTFLASFLAEITDRNYTLAGCFCVLVTSLGWLSSLKIEKTYPKAIDKEFTFNLFSDVYQNLKKASRQRYLVPVIIYGAFFLFVGAFTQLNIIPLGLESLGLTEVSGGYLFLTTAVGIAIGSICVGKCSKKEIELGFIPLAAIGVSMCLIFLYFFAEILGIVLGLLFFLGVFGGFYIVPVDSFIQYASKEEDRGQNVAASNFMNFLGVVIASFLIALFGNFFHFSAKEGFLIIGITTIFISMGLILVLADQLFRLIVTFFARFFWTLKIQNKPNFDQEPLLVLGERKAWMDTVIMMAILPRLVRYIVPISKEKMSKRTFWYRLLKIIPLDDTVFSMENSSVKLAIEKEIKQGHSVCLLQPPNQSLNHFNFTNIQKVNIVRKSPKEKIFFSELIALFQSPVDVTFER